MKWIELSVTVDPEAVDAVANVFHQEGTGGISIEQHVESDDEGVDTLVLQGRPVIKAYLPAVDHITQQERRIEEGLWHLRAFDLAPIGELQRCEVDEKDWEDGWKRHFHPLKVGRVVIKPTWRSYEVGKDDIVIELDPGMAFGTGLHPTTHLVLEELQSRALPGMQVLDLGTGSGILALAAAELGATVLALDTSAVAVEVCRSNVHANGLVDRIQVETGSLADVAGRTFDLILANILASVLIDMAPLLAGALRTGGEVLGSGIINDRLDDVRRSWTKAGLRVMQARTDGDWCLLGAGAPA